LFAGRAAADDDVALARRHFEAGTRAYNLGEFKTAAEEYRRMIEGLPSAEHKGCLYAKVAAPRVRQGVTIRHRPPVKFDE
jgi:hypothetical protein